jgi:hypothetical protein
MSSFLSNITKPLESFKSWVSSPSKKKLLYHLKDGSLGDESLLSRKGVGLCEINRLGMHVPPTFIMSTEASLEYRK